MLTAVWAQLALQARSEWSRPIDWFLHSYRVKRWRGWVQCDCRSEILTRTSALSFDRARTGSCRPICCETKSYWTVGVTFNPMNNRSQVNQWRQSNSVGMVPVNTLSLTADRLRYLLSMVIAIKRWYDKTGLPLQIGQCSQLSQFSGNRAVDVLRRKGPSEITCEYCKNIHKAHCDNSQSCHQSIGAGKRRATRTILRHGETRARWSRTIFIDQKWLFYLTKLPK